MAAERAYTSKQMGDACEMLVAAEMTLAGVPAMKVPDNWPGYDVVAQPKDGRSPQRVSVKSRTFKRGARTAVAYDANDDFDWLAIVLLPGEDQTGRRFFILPRSIADARACKDRPTAKTANWRFWRLDKVADVLGDYENNFALSLKGAKAGGGVFAPEMLAAAFPVVPDRVRA